MKHLLFASLFAIIITGFYSCTETNAKASLAGALSKTVADTTEPAPAPSEETVVVKEEKKSIKIIGVGDMMLGTNYPSANYLPANQGKNLMASLHPILQSGDLTFGNAEGTFLDKGGSVKRCNDPSKCYAFRQPEYLADRLVDAGFDVVSIANNHLGDFGYAGRQNTMKCLDDRGICYAGQTTCPKKIFEKDGIKYGFAAFAPNSGTVDIRDLAGAKKIVEELEKEVDIVIVSFHGGAEGAKNCHVTCKTETFYGENRGNVNKFAHTCIDAGADIIFGHGPHVTRAIELYKERFIIYSMGNFCTYARFNLRGISGLAPIVELDVDTEGKFLGGKLHSVIQKGEGGPRLDPNNGAVKEVIRLTKADFPNTLIEVSAEGIMSVKE